MARRRRRMTQGEYPMPAAQQQAVVEVRRGTLLSPEERLEESAPLQGLEVSAHPVWSPSSQEEINWILGEERPWAPAPDRMMQGLDVSLDESVFAALRADREGRVQGAQTVASNQELSRLMQASRALTMEDLRRAQELLQEEIGRVEREPERGPASPPQVYYPPLETQRRIEEMELAAGVRASAPRQAGERPSHPLVLREMEEELTARAGRRMAVRRNVSELHARSMTNIQFRAYLNNAADQLVIELSADVGEMETGVPETRLWAGEEEVNRRQAGEAARRVAAWLGAESADALIDHVEQILMREMRDAVSRHERHFRDDLGRRAAAERVRLEVERMRRQRMPPVFAPLGIPGIPPLPEGVSPEGFYRILGLEAYMPPGETVSGAGVAQEEAGPAVKRRVRRMEGAGE